MQVIKGRYIREGKRAISIFLAMAMLLSFMAGVPATALAAEAPIMAQANLLENGFYGITDYVIYTISTGTRRHASTDAIKSIDMKVDNGQMTVTMYMQGYGTENNTWITDIVNIQKDTDVTASVMDRDGDGRVTVFRFTVPYTEERILMGLPTTSSDLTTARYLEMNMTTAAAKADKYSLYIALKEANAVQALGQGSFTDASWNALLDAITAAQGVFDNASASQGDVNAQVGLVHNAIDSLVTEGGLMDKSVLNAKILEAERLDKGDHTDASWNALQAALTEAKATAEKEDATQFEVNQKARALQAALDGRAYNSPVVEVTGLNLKKALLEALGSVYSDDMEAQNAIITENMLAALTALDAPDRDIKDITGLYKAVNLESLNLSGNPLDDSNRSSGSFGDFFQNFSAFSKLKHLDLSNCQLGDNSLGVYANDPMIPGDVWRLSSDTLPNMPSLVSVDVSDNDIVGAFAFEYNGRYEHLTSLDLSGNRFNQITNFDGSRFPVLESLDLSDNYLYWNEGAGSWIEPLMLAGDVVRYDGQKNLADLFSVQQHNKATTSSYKYIKADNENDTLTLEDFSGDTIISFLGFGIELTTKVTVGDKKVTAATMSGPRTVSNDNMLLTLTGYSPGAHELPVTVMFLNGETHEYTLQFTVTAVPNEGEDSAGIVDPYLQAAVCNKLGQPTSHVVTQTDMAGMTGSLNVFYVRDAEGIQYATGLTSLKLKGAFVALPDLSGLTKLTSLSLLSDYFEKKPDLSALTALKSLTVCGAADDGFPDLANQTSLTTLILDNVGTKDYPTEMSATIKTLEVHRANGKTYGVPETLTGLTSFRFTPNSTGESYNAPSVSSASLDLSGVDNITAPASLSVTIGGGTTATTGLSANSAALNSLYIYLEEGTTLPEGLGDVPNLTGTLSIYYNTSGELPDDYAKLTKVTRLTLNGSYADVPEEIASMTELTYLGMQSCGLTNFTTDLSNTKLTTLDLWGNRLRTMPSADLLPATLGSMDLSASQFTTVDEETAAGYAKMTALKELKFESVPFTAFPSALIKNLPALTTLNARFGRYADIPADSFDNSQNLKTVRLGASLRVNKDAAGVLSFADGSGGAAAVATLKANVPAASVTLEAGTTDNFAYANLVGIASSLGTIAEDLYNARALSLSVAEGTSSLTLTADALLPDTVITVNGQTYAEGDPIQIDNLVKGNNTVTLSCYNGFENYLLTDTTVVYTLNIFVGDYVSDDFPAEGHTYSVKYRVYKNGQTEQFSMADSYFTKTATVPYKDNMFAISFTTTKSSWIPDMHYYLDGELLAAELVEKNNTTDHATYRIYAHSLADNVVINPHVTPMGYAPLCDLRFDTQQIIDITDTLPSVDKTDLAIAINRAEAELAKSFYTDASYDALKTAADAAKAVNENETATQEQVDGAEAALVSAISGLEVDQSKLANKALLKTALDEAKAVKKGKHTDTAWNALQNAIADAQAVHDELTATQKEVDSATKTLKTAITLFNSSGEASELDKDNLKDGVYTLTADMIKINRQDYSMSNDAIGHKVTLTVEDGAYCITMEFKGLRISDQFGYLSRLQYYGEGFSYDNYGNPQGTLLPATVLSPQQDDNGNVIVDQYNDAANPYPKQLQFTLVNKADYKDNYVSLQVFVPIMEAISAGSGTQDVLMRLDWTTLKEQEEPSVDKSSLLTKIDEAKACQAQKDKYTDDSYAASGLEAAITAAEAVLNNDAATKEQVSEQVNALNDAMNKLVLWTENKTDKTILTAKVAEAKAIAKGDYTDASWEALQTAITAAQAVAENETATQQDVDDTAAALTEAINGLKKRPAAPGTDTLSDEATGVKLEAEAGVLPEGTTMKAIAVTTGADYEKAKLALEGIGGSFRLYDITLLGTDGSTIQPNGKVKVSIPVPEGMKEDLIAVYGINADGTKTLLESSVENGYVVFYTGHFSLYAIVEKSSAAGDADGGKPDKKAVKESGKSAVPETGSNDPSLLWRLLPLAAAAAMALLMASRRRKEGGKPA